MELKGTKDWSDYDDKDGERKSVELPKPRPEVAPEPPERRTPMFDLGLIYDRGDMPRETLKPVSEERDHVQPELAQGVSLGTPELSNITPSVPTPEQIAQLEISKAQAHIQETNDEQDDEDNADRPVTQPSQPGRPQVSDNRPNERPAPSPEQNVDEELVRTEQEPLSTPLAPAEAYIPPQVIETTASPDDFQPDVQPQPRSHPIPPITSMPPVGGGMGGNKLPPPPPTGPGNTYPGPPQSPNYNYGGNYSPPPQWSSPNTASAYMPPNTANFVTMKKFELARIQERRRRAAMMIVVAALTWYLARRPIKPLREQVKRLEEATQHQNEQIARLTTEQQSAQQRLTEQQRQIEQFTQPSPATFEQQAAAAFNMQHGLKPVGEQVRVVGQPQQVALQPNQRYEIAGSYGAVFDEKNQVMPNAATYGEAYQQDVARERMPNPFGPRNRQLGGGAGFGGPVASGSGIPILPNPTAGGLPSSNSPSQYDVLSDVPKPNPVVSAITSPWLWLCAGILLIAFFAAATI